MLGHKNRTGDICKTCLHVKKFRTDYPCTECDFLHQMCKYEPGVCISPLEIELIKSKLNKIVEEMQNQEFYHNQLRENQTTCCVLNSKQQEWISKLCMLENELGGLVE
jgi:hypothetical protein